MYRAMQAGVLKGNGARSASIISAATRTSPIDPAAAQTAIADLHGHRLDRGAREQGCADDEGIQFLHERRLSLLQLHENGPRDRPLDRELGLVALEHDARETSAARVTVAPGVTPSAAAARRARRQIARDARDAPARAGPRATTAAAGRQKLTWKHPQDDS